MSYYTVNDGTLDGQIIMHGGNTKNNRIISSEKKNETTVKISQGKLPSRKLDSNDLGDVVKVATKTASRDDVEKLQYLMRLLTTEDKPCTQKDLATKLNANHQVLSRFMRREKGATLPGDVKSRANNLLIRLEKEQKKTTENDSASLSRSSNTKGKEKATKK